MGILARIRGQKPIKTVSQQHREAGKRETQTRVDIEYEKARRKERIKVAGERGRASARQPSKKRRIATGLLRVGENIAAAQRGRTRRTSARRTQRSVRYIERRRPTARRTQRTIRSRKRRTQGFDPTRNPYL